MYIKIFVNIPFTVSLFSSVTEFVLVWAPRADVEPSSDHILRSQQEVRQCFSGKFRALSAL